MSGLTISTRVMGRRKPVVTDWQLPSPPDERSQGQPLTLRQLITRTVLHEVKAFKQRQSEGRFVRVLTERQIEAGLEQGRVDAGGRALRQELDPEAAVAT